MIYPNHDYNDVPKEPSYVSATDRIAAYVEKEKVTTIGRISRAFPELRPVIQGLLNGLRADGKVFWEDYRPLPTLIYAGNSKGEATIDWLKKGH